MPQTSSHESDRATKKDKNDNMDHKNTSNGEANICCLFDPPKKGYYGGKIIQYKCRHERF